MKKLLCACSAILGLTISPALAAPPAATSWTGCYVDGGVGYGFWKQTHFTETYPPPVLLTSPTSNGGDGWLGRLGAGCDYQASRFVLGAFGDYDFMSLKGSSEFIVPGSFSLPDPTFSGNERESAAWSIGARVGFLLTPSLLTYVDGGYTQARFDQVGFGDLATPFTPNIYSMPANTYHGWFVGGGTEYALDPAWVGITGLAWRTEYRFSSYQAADLPVSVTATGVPTGLAENVKHTVQTVTTGLVWRFNFFAAPVARPPLATKD